MFTQMSTYMFTHKLKSMFTQMLIQIFVQDFQGFEDIPNFQGLLRFLKITYGHVPLQPSA